MHNQDLGRVAVVARGAYDPSTEYERLDAVSYNGSSYLVRKHCRGVEPAEGEDYMLMAKAGDSTAANAAAVEALAAAERADSASGRANAAAGNADEKAAAAGAAAVSANEAAAETKNVVNTVIPDVNKLKNDLDELSIYDIDIVKNSLYNLWTVGDFEKDYTGGTWAFLEKSIELSAGSYTIRIKNSKFSTNGYLRIGYGSEGTGAEIIKIYENGIYTFNVTADTTVYFLFQISLGTSEENGNYYINDITLINGDNTDIIPHDKTGVDKIYDTLQYSPNPRIKKLGSLTGGTFGFGSNSIPNVKNNYSISFTAKIDSFGDNGLFAIARGYITNHYAGSVVEIDRTNIVVYKFTTEKVQVSSTAHGLSLSNRLHVTVIVHDNQTADIIMISGDWKKIVENVYWCGCNGVLQVYCNSSVTLSDLSISFFSNEFNKDIWGFGDSYFDLWTYKVIPFGFTEIMFDGFSGRNSEQALVSLKAGLSFNTPKKILWCMGMNDADSDSFVNSSWQSVFNELKTICSDKKIELILSTIPNTPVRNHSYKNTIIRNSGYRYVDICKTVGADESTEWYDSLLNIDNVHPTDAGMYVIGSKFMADVPECVK